MKKSFIILTFVTPLLMSLLMFMPVLIAEMGDSTEKNIEVIDHTGLYINVLQSNETYHFNYVSQTPEEVREKSKAEGSAITALLVITENLAENPKAATLYAEKQVNVETKDYIARLLNKYVEEQKLAAYNIENIDEIIKNSKSDISLATIKWSDSGEEKEGSAELALMIGMIAGMLIYMFLMIYGGQVMSGVVQEKTSRIVEVIVSSVKPFELMLGKIIGIALVGLTQVLMWVVLTMIIYGVLSPFLHAGQMPSSELLNGVQNVELTDTQQIFALLKGFNFLQIGILFVLYFLGGYFLYASLFAAVGSAVDNETDTQQFTLPIMLPIIMAIFAGIYASQHPDAPLSFWTSIIPFTSPVVMMARLPFGIPAWEIALSLTVLLLSFIGTTWLAGKIYRTGILMYGKKPSWKEIWKWIKY